MPCVANPLKSNPNSLRRDGSYNKMSGRPVHARSLAEQTDPISSLWSRIRFVRASFFDLVLASLSGPERETPNVFAYRGRSAPRGESGSRRVTRARQSNRPEPQVADRHAALPVADCLGALVRNNPDYNALRPAPPDRYVGMCHARDSRCCSAAKLAWARTFPVRAGAGDGRGMGHSANFARAARRRATGPNLRPCARGELGLFPLGAWLRKHLGRSHSRSTRRSNVPASPERGLAEDSWARDHIMLLSSGVVRGVVHVDSSLCSAGLS